VDITEQKLRIKHNKINNGHDKNSLMII